MSSDNGMVLPEDVDEGNLASILRARVVPLSPDRLQEMKDRLAAQAENRQEKLTIIVMVHHSPVDGSTDSIDARSEYVLDDREQMYKRSPKNPLDVGQHTLDLGWISKPGYIVLQNKSTPPISNGSNDEELAEWAEFPPTIFIGDFELGPADLMIAKISSLANLPMGIRVANKPALISINVLPR